MKNVVTLKVGNLIQSDTILKNRKEDNFICSETIVVNTDKGLNTKLDVRFYRKGKYFYCCIWGSTMEGICYRGGGMGYYKHAAFKDALTQCGFIVTGTNDLIWERGIDYLITLIAEDILRLKPLTGYIIVSSHG